MLILLDYSNKNNLFQYKPPLTIFNGRSYRIMLKTRIGMFDKKIRIWLGIQVLIIKRIP